MKIAKYLFLYILFFSWSAAFPHAYGGVDVDGSLVTFSLDAPHADHVWVTGSWTGWITPMEDGEEAVAHLELIRDIDGIWRKSISFPAPDEYQYKFIVDGLWLEDPDNNNKARNDFGTQNALFTTTQGEWQRSADAFKPGTGTLRIQTRDKRRDIPLGRCTARFSSPVPVVLSTDNRGRLVLENIAEGTYTLTLMKTAYEPATISVHVVGSNGHVPVHTAYLTPAQGDSVPFYYNANSDLCPAQADEIAAIHVIGEFNRWQHDQPMRDGDGDHIWEGRFPVDANVTESDYSFSIQLVNEEDTINSPDPEGEYVTPKSYADCVFRRWPINEPVVTIQRPTNGRVSPTAPEYLVFRYVAPNTHAGDDTYSPRPTRVTTWINGKRLDTVPEAVPGSDGTFSLSLPALPQGEVSIAVDVYSDDGKRGRDSVTLWLGSVETENDAVYSDETPSSQTDPPEWLNDAIIYHALVRSYDDSDGNIIGDFRGMREKLGHIADMGFNTLLLMPVWDGPSSHGYTINSCRRVEEDYGTESDFKDLIDACHAQGMRVILDFNDTTTYTGHPLFGRAVRDKDSPFRRWIYWLGADTYSSYTLKGDMANGGWPQFNFNNPAVRHYFVDVLNYWVEVFGVDGFRLDSVERIQPGPNHGWWRVLRRELKDRNPDTVLLGEIYSEDRKYFDNQFDIAYDTAFNRTLRSAARGETSVRDLADVIEQGKRIDASGASQLRFLSNHDSDRWMTFVGGDNDRARIGLAALLTLPGVPSLYYGCEFGMMGAGIWGPNMNRGFMEWNTGDTNLHNMIRALVKLRAQEPALHNDGTCEIVEADTEKGLLVIRRGSATQFGTNGFLLAFNFGDTEQSVELPAGRWNLELSSAHPPLPLPAHGFGIWRDGLFD